MRYSRWQSFVSRKHEESGQTTVEFVLSATLFLLLLFAVFDFGFLFFAKLTLQNAVRTAGRYAITGDCSSGSCFDSTNPTNRLQTILNTVQTYSFFLSPTVTVRCGGGCASGYGGGGNNAGGPGDTVTITATYVFHPIITYRFFTGGSYTITVSSSYKNEIFAPAPS